MTSRWIGGTLTNFDEVSKNYKKLKDLDVFLTSYKTSDYTKRELLEFRREKRHLEDLYGGITDMLGSPDAVFVIDTHLETTAISEARKLDITTIGIVDTNADPMIIDYPIPANDDAVGSVKLITSYLMDAWIEGKKPESKAKPAKTEVSKAIEPKVKRPKPTPVKAEAKA
jgi:small subunit ribosomal protein S2